METFFSEKPDSCCSPAPCSPDIRRYRQKILNQVRCYHSSATYHQLTLLTGGKKMEVESPLMQARFIEIRKVYAKQRSDTFVTVVYSYEY